jgi:periplasmic protein TonB
MSGTYSLPLYKDRTVSAFAAFMAHVLFFAVSGFAFSHQAEYGVELGAGGMEIHLTAAPAAPVPAPPSPDTMTVEEAPKPVSESDEILLAPAVQQVKPEPVLPKQILTQAVSEFRGDGSSAVPGKDNTTLHTMGGAETAAKPNYLKNPAPRYPEEARQAKQEGVVVLVARVAPSGTADAVSVKASSGYSLLDDAALKAVQKWKFKPAKVGKMPVASQVEIPVRFQLDKKAF